MPACTVADGYSLRELFFYASSPGFAQRSKASLQAVAEGIKRLSAQGLRAAIQGLQTAIGHAWHGPEALATESAALEVRLTTSPASLSFVSVHVSTMLPSRDAFYGSGMQYTMQLPGMASSVLPAQGSACCRAPINLNPIACMCGISPAVKAGFAHMQEEPCSSQ